LGYLWIAASGLESVLGQPDFQSPPIEKLVSVRAGATGDEVSWNDLLDELSAADVVFLGETHDDDTTHRVEYGVLAGLLSRRNSRVVLALEMFERDVQSTLDDYLAGKIDEATFLKSARPWQNYAEAYRPLVEAAKAAGAPVVASNFPRPLRSQMMGQPEKVLSSLGANRGWAPAEFRPNSEVYWKRTDNAVRGHLAMMKAMEGGNRVYSTQSLWDNAMGESCALALDRHPGSCVVHVNGGFHTAYWDGTANQLRQRKPEAKIKTVAILPASSPASATQRGAPVADYVVWAEERAGNLNDGRWSVFVNRKLEYQLHIPSDASPEHPVPLLIWLGDEGLTSDEGLRYWKEAVGAQAAILAMDPPYRERQRDLSSGGRWFWIDHFSEDIGAMIGAVDRAWSYVLERYPIDSGRVCLAGEGAGATVVAAATLLTERMELRSVAIQPRQFSKIKDFPLPLLEDWGDRKPPVRTLRIVGASSDHAWWREELAEYQAVGLPADWVDLSQDPWDAASQVDQSVRTALGLGSEDRFAGAERQFLRIDSRSPLPMAWARLAARRASDEKGYCVAVAEAPQDGSSRELLPRIGAEDFRKGAGLPKCPGPFGGTTVLVVADEDRGAWFELAQEDPINKASRFHRLRIATSGEGEGGLASVLSELEGQKRTNVLVVPAAFYAGEAALRALEEIARPYQDRMTIHWLPGVGGQDVALGPK
jgi:uncharacterized iron-regulated protein